MIQEVIVSGTFLVMVFWPLKFESVSQIQDSGNSLRTVTAASGSALLAIAFMVVLKKGLGVVMYCGANPKLATGYILPRNYSSRECTFGQTHTF